MSETTNKINELRKVMGTLPDQNPELKTKFYRGVEGISVELIEAMENPYKPMFVLGTTCWGKNVNKWEETSPENRFEVVKAILKGQALPLALEVPQFSFAIEGPSRAAFDQLARARLGVVFSARGMRDNNWKDASIRIPTSLWPSEQERLLHDEFMNGSTSEKHKDAYIKCQNFSNIEDTMLEVKHVYADIVDVGKGSWQAARCVLPLYVVYGFSMAINFQSLKSMCSSRMKFCEMSDTVAVAWLLAKAVSEKFPLLGSYLRPGCDWTGKCQYHKSYTLSEMFGCLFSECGRNECSGSNDYAEFNETCTDYHELEDQLGIHITKPDEWPNFERFEDLPEIDKARFIEA
jgi:thymidylate synthase ThyX